MKNKILLALFLIGMFGFSGCKTKVKPVSDLVKKVWIVQSVKENNVEVYKSGGTSNLKPGYGSYRLDLTNSPTVVLKVVDGGTYTGRYEITTSKLSLTTLSPEPTGTGGTLDFSVTTATETSLVFTSSMPYPKTGNTTNVYSLIPAN